jgi:hypothetical protein
MNSREAIYAALYARLSGISGWGLVARKLHHIEDLQPSQFPAGFQVQLSEDVLQEFNKPPIYTMRVEWWMYAYQPDDAQAHSPQLNALVDAALAALNVTVAGPNASQTLGGIVTAVWLDGRIDYVDGALGDRSFVRIPIAIKVPD